MNCVTHAATENAEPCVRCGLAYCGDCVVVVRGERLCAHCKDERLRDVASGVGSEGQPLARLFTRLAAYLLDRVIVFLLLVPAQYLMPQRFTPIPVTVIAFLYEGWMLTSRGQTLGKIALHIRVVDAGGTTLSRERAWRRATLRLVIDLCALLGTLSHRRGLIMTSGLMTLADCFAAFVTSERATLRDLLARTRVLRVT
jgi:uncharacterized RDD family membrane protein YckC